MSLISIWHILLALLIFGFLIFIHEGGHYLTARLFGVSIKEFSIGMGPKLFARVSEKNGILYSLRALPIGGYVAMEGEDDDSDDPNAFRRKPVWQRMIITVAGAFMNIFIGAIVMMILVAAMKEPLCSNRIGEFVYNESGVSYSERAGLRLDDVIVAIDGTPVHIANETVYEIMRKGIYPVTVTVLRDGERVDVENVSFQTESEDGIVYGTVDFRVYPEAKTFASVLKHGFWRSISTIKMIWESLYDLVTGRYGLGAVSGVVGVTKSLGEAADTGLSNLVYLAVVISMNLGVMNLLPLPALDGGRLVFQFIELIRRKPLKAEVEGYIHFGGIVVLMILMVIITVKDIIGLF